ncbi:NAD-dependent epimerase/dehydratase family protein [bacterium]|nr:NAD-dependent epimerase/dehydratase family protein [bacterium]
MRIIVTGGAGFVGSNLVHHLVRRGEEVGVIDGFVEGSGANQMNLEGFRGEVLKANILAPQEYSSFLKGVDAVVHLAGHVSHVDSMVDPIYDLEQNALGTLRLLWAVEEHAPEALFVYGGTRGQYGIVPHPPATPESALYPTDIYGVNKTAGEQYGMVLSRTGRLRACSLRFTNAYGPRHQMKHGKWGILNWFLRLAMDDRELTVYGTGSQLREYAYIEDIVRAFSAAVRAGADVMNGRILNLGAPVRVSFRKMAEEVVGAAGKGRVTTIPWPSDRKAIEVGDFVSEDSDARALLSWEPIVGLQEGLAKTVAFYKERQESYW